LTEAQRQAVTAQDRLLCVLAGAGAGKTRVLTLRVARRVHDGSAMAEHVLVCTFSRKAADELRRRLWTLHVGNDVRAGTFHRTALHLLRQQRADRGAPPPTVLPDRRAALATVLEAGGAPPDRGSRQARLRPIGPYTPSVAQLETEIGWAKARLIAPDGYESAARHERRRPAMGAARIAELYGRYEDNRRRQGLLDLDDLLWTCADLLEEDGRFAAAVHWRFRHLFVDEMQDVNPAQFRLLRALLGENPDLFVVGDPNQSVYGWNGADPTLLDRLPDILPGTRVVRLDENHRCSPQVVTVAVAALGLADGGVPTSTRPDGPLPRITEHATDHDEAAWVAREAWIAHRPGRRWSEIAVLARTNAQLGPLADALRAERVPFHLAGGELGPASDVRHVGTPSRPDEPQNDDPPGHGTGTGDRGPGDGEADQPGPTDGVVLTTFHRAKGLQWPAVFVVGLSDGLVPMSSARTPAAKDEERRLLYVALTRAEDELACSWAAHRNARAQEAGTAPRRPSPWLEGVVKARAELEVEAAAPDPGDVATHLAELRARLGNTS
jgi:DNA helicase-2/ATP-dependent DNA helicase PcrA